MSTVLFVETYLVTGNITITPPANATVGVFELWGGGGAGGVWVSPISPISGGGGAYAKKTYTLQSGDYAGIAAHVGVGVTGDNSHQYQSGDATWVGNATPANSSCIAFASGGIISAAGSQTTKGDTTYQGAYGLLNSADFGPGTGGGGSAGPDGAGGYGGSGGSPGAANSGYGGTGDNGLGGNGGTYLSPNGVANPNGGGGGAGQAGINNAKGGNGAIPGGGGGVGTDASLGGVGGDGAQGQIRVTWTITVPTETYCIPICIGKTYTSQGQILRPVTPQEGGTPTGPSLGKKRRIVTAGPLLYSAQGVQQGVDFLKMRAIPLVSSGGSQTLTALQIFSGVAWGPVDADWNYDSLWCWQITRPYPCTVVAVECQLEVSENN